MKWNFAVKQNLITPRRLECNAEPVCRNSNKMLDLNLTVEV